MTSPRKLHPVRYDDRVGRVSDKKLNENSEIEFHHVTKTNDAAVLVIAERLALAREVVRDNMLSNARKVDPDATVVLAASRRR